MMNPTREPRSTATEPTQTTDPRDILPDDAVVAYLRDRAPGMPAVRFDARAVTSQARGALNRRRRRTRYLVVAAATTATAYLALALAGPLPVPGLGTVSVPGSSALRAMVQDVLPAQPPGSGEWQTDVDRLEADVLPVFEKHGINYYLLESETHLVEYPYGNFCDGKADCQGLVPFDAKARSDFDEVTRAVERSGVELDRIYRNRGAIYFQFYDSSWQYDWFYVYLPDAGTPPAKVWPEEEWTHIRGNWWFYRGHDD